MCRVSGVGHVCVGSVGHMCRVNGACISRVGVCMCRVSGVRA